MSRASLSRVERIVTNGEESFVEKSIDLGYVEKITVSRKVSLVEAPVFVLPSRNRYIVDTGNVESISLDLVRPAIPTSPSTDPSEMMTSSQWWEKFAEFIDVWQNKSYNRVVRGERVLTGGYILHIDPCEDDRELFPEFDGAGERNVFIKGSVDLKTDVGKIKYHMDLIVGTMNSGAGEVKNHSVDAVFGYTSGSTEKEYFNTQYYVDMSAHIPDFPPEIKSDPEYYAWRCNQTGAIVRPNSVVGWDELNVSNEYLNDPARLPLKFVPIKLKKLSTATYWYNNGVEQSIYVPDNAYLMRYILVGGGGAGAEGDPITHQMTGNGFGKPTYVGGGGGAGQVIRGSIYVNSNTFCSVRIGKGGVGGFVRRYGGNLTGRKSGDGERSVLRADGVEYIAEPGLAGKGTLSDKNRIQCEGGSGAKGSGAGGNGCFQKGSGYVVDRNAAPSNGLKGNSSPGGTPGVASDFGAGGGSAPLGGSDPYVSKGGDGAIPDSFEGSGYSRHAVFRDYHATLNGVHGGGGASFAAPEDTVFIPDIAKDGCLSGDGGDGLLYVQWYSEVR